MKLRFLPYTLELKRSFTIAAGSRLSTPAMLVELEHDGIIGNGEASMPPYLGESHQSAAAFLSRVDLSHCTPPFNIENMLRDVDAIAPGNHAAKAAVDIALHDWIGKDMGLAWHQIWGLNPNAVVPTSYTIGIDSPDRIRERVRDAEDFQVLKVKLGSDHDREIIQTIRDMTDKPLRVDVNQGWKERESTLGMIEWLATQNVELIEQPLPREQIDDIAWLRERSPLPLVADEAVSRLSDIRSASSLYHGINIKLMKCTGMHEAFKMIATARTLGLKVMIGCMTETSCAISAAAQLAPMADWVDLDGALLIRNDPFTGATIVDGRIVFPKDPGIGARKITEYRES